MEEERQRVAALRRMQIESEQFRYFEDQLRRQELANRRGEEAELKVTLGSTVLLLQLIPLLLLIELLLILILILLLYHYNCF